MPKKTWIDTLKTVQTEGPGYNEAAYHRQQQNLANVDLEDEPAEKVEEEEWSYAQEVFGQKIEVVHPIELRQEGGIAACLRSKLDMSRCYAGKMILLRPHIVPDTTHVLQEIFPTQMADGLGPNGRVLNILGFDRFFLSHELGCAVFNLYMHDGRLDLKSYSGNYGGRRNLRPRFAHTTLEVVETPEWIWTPEKP